jgi:DNA-binding MarR family transcriptional regulator
VVFTSPYDRESYVALNSSIDIEFSDSMLLDSLIAGIRIRPETPIGGTIFIGHAVSLLPRGGLAPNTTYLVNISADVTSAYGVPMGAEYGLHFHTGPSAPAAILWGELKDENGSAVPGATVEVVDALTGEVVQVVQTDAEGKYYADLRPGREYYLRIKYPDGTSQETPPFDMNGDRTAPKTTKPKPNPDPGGGPGPDPGDGPGAEPAVVEPQLPWMDFARVGALLGIGVFAGALALGGEAARYAVVMTVAPLYARMRRDRRRDDFVRGQIYGHILSHPGTTYGVIQRTVGVGNGTLSYHLYHLEGEGFVRSERDGWFRRLYPAWAPRGAGDPILSDIQRRIVEIAETDPGMTQSDIAMLMGESRQTVNYNVSRLVQAGFLRLDGWGSQKKCYVAPPRSGPVNVITPHLPRPRGKRAPGGMTATGTTGQRAAGQASKTGLPGRRPGRVQATRPAQKKGPRPARQKAVKESPQP